MSYILFRTTGALRPYPPKILPSTWVGSRAGLHRQGNLLGRRSSSPRASMIPARKRPTPLAPEGSVQTEALTLGSGLESVLGQGGALVMQRQLEMLNVFIGLEQANKYSISDVHGRQVGWLAEEEGSFLGGALARQFLRTSRPFKATILDQQGQVVLQMRRPFSWINSRIYVEDAQGKEIGLVQQRWHLWRRRYDLVLGGSQFAEIDAGFLSWDFTLLDEEARRIGNIGRNFQGFAREIFTDTGNYVLEMETTQEAGTIEQHPLSLEERSVMLASAVSIDVDYFSRHSSHGHGGLLPFGMFGGTSPPPSEAGAPGSASSPPGTPYPMDPSSPYENQGSGGAGTGMGEGGQEDGSWWRIFDNASDEDAGGWFDEE